MGKVTKMLEEQGHGCDTHDHVVHRPLDLVVGEMWKRLKPRAQEGFHEPCKGDFQRPGTKRNVFPRLQGGVQRG